MPRDEWLRENNRVKYGRIGLSRRERRAKRIKRQPINYEVRGLAVVLNTIVWFGKHKGRRGREVPKDYWQWLVAQHTTSSGERMDKFLSFVAGYG